MFIRPFIIKILWLTFVVSHFSTASNAMLSFLQLLERKSSISGEQIIVDTGKRGHGYCVDTNPDKKIYQVTESVFISSQDGAQNFEELKEKKISHILNVASGIKNAFPEVC